MKRVLVVVSSYNPAILADMQRARMLAWEWPKCGWEVEVLSPAASEVRQDAVEPDGDAFFNPEVKVHHVKSIARPLFRMCSLRSHTWPTFLPMLSEGRRLLKSGAFDLVYISTATFNFFSLGAMWKRRMGTPYFLDYHDPWISDNGLKDGSIKTRFNHLVSVKMERHAIRDCDGVVAVSPNYIAGLSQRYGSQKPPGFFTERAEVIPFACRPDDFKCVSPPPPNASPYIVYVGAGGSIMKKAFNLLCKSLAAFRRQKPQTCNGIKIKLFGTGFQWVPGAAKDLQQVAESHGVADLVEEDPRRVSYRKSIELLVQSAGALVLGVDDRGYIPSKLFPYSLSGKPLLAILHRQSPAYAIIQDNQSLGHALWFDDDSQIDDDQAMHELEAFYNQVAVKAHFAREQEFCHYTAKAMAENHISFFEKCLATSDRQRG